MEVHVRNMNELGALADLPDEIEHQEYRQADISGDESVHIPMTSQEDLESVQQDDHCDEENSKVRCVGLEGSFIGERITVDIVVLQTMVKSDVGDQDNIPGDETGDRGDVDEPLEYGGTAR